MLEDYKKELDGKLICVECGRMDKEEEFSFCVDPGYYEGPMSAGVEAEYTTKCPDCSSGEDDIEDQYWLFQYFIGENYDKDMEYEFYDTGLNDVDEAYNVHIVVLNPDGLVVERIFFEEK